MKREIWRHWITDTVLQDILASDTPDPVPFFDTVDGKLETSETLGKYKWGKNDGDYLYLVYLLDEPAEDVSAVTPIYVGESSNISTRIGQHSREIRDALPTTEWEDSGKWGSFSKYDHMAAIYEQVDSPFYVWIVDVDDLEYGPYGYETYRQELEAKLVGLIYSQDRYRRICANREFVPNRVHRQIGKAGSEWISLETDGGPLSQAVNREQTPVQSNSSKAECWEEWVDDTILADIRDTGMADPIPLFDVDNDLEVRLTEKRRLKRSDAIDAQIRTEGKKFVDQTGIRDESYDGLLYVMYQIDGAVEDVGASDIVPRYIGKAEASGKKQEMSNNFIEIANNRNATTRFARWGDGDFWHVGELSMALLEGDDRKAHWVDALFEPGTRKLNEQTYLWVYAWSSNDIGPYGVPATLAEVEPLLIGLAYGAYPEKLLNKSGTPDNAPVKMRKVRNE